MRNAFDFCFDEAEEDRTLEVVIKAWNTRTPPKTGDVMKDLKDHVLLEKRLLNSLLFIANDYAKSMRNLTFPVLKEAEKALNQDLSGMVVAPLEADDDIIQSALDFEYEGETIHDFMPYGPEIGLTNYIKLLYKAMLSAAKEKNDE